MRSSGATGLIAYDYITVHAPARLETFYRRAYAGLGWQEGARVDLLPDPDTVSLKFTRDCRIKHRPGMTRLQRSCEDSLAAIARLEKATRVSGRWLAVGVGAFIAFLLVLVVLALAGGHVLLAAQIGGAIVLIAAFGFAVRDRARDHRAARLAPALDQHYHRVRECVREAEAALS